MPRKRTRGLPIVFGSVRACGDKRRRVASMACTYRFLPYCNLGRITHHATIKVDWTKDTNGGKSDSTKCDGEQAAIT